jgi:hypothetical protein
VVAQVVVPVRTQGVESHGKSTKIWGQILNLEQLRYFK